MLRKSYDIASCKALTDDAGKLTGELEMLVSTFGNVDLIGDKVMPDAFDKSLGQWQESGDPIPMVWTHMIDDPFAYMGSWDPERSEAVKSGDKPGLLLRGSVDMDNPMAAQIHSLLAKRIVKQASFTYFINDERPGKDGSNELWELDLKEAGPTLLGVNQETEMLVAKALKAHDKAGRVLSSKNEASIRTAVETLQGVLASLGDEKAVRPEDLPQPAPAPAPDGEPEVEPETTEPEPITVPTKTDRLRRRLQLVELS